MRLEATRRANARAGRQAVVRRGRQISGSAADSAPPRAQPASTTSTPRTARRGQLNSSRPTGRPPTGHCRTHRTAPEPQDRRRLGAASQFTGPASRTPPEPYSEPRDRLPDSPDPPQVQGITSDPLLPLRLHRTASRATDACRTHQAAACCTARAPDSHPPSINKTRRPIRRRLTSLAQIRRQRARTDGDGGLPPDSPAASSTHLSNDRPGRRIAIRHDQTRRRPRPAGVPKLLRTPSARSACIPAPLPGSAAATLRRYVATYYPLAADPI